MGNALPANTVRLNDSFLVQLFDFGDFWRWELVDNDGGLVQQGFGDDEASACGSAEDSLANL
jgi:hypothetical protein